MAAPYATGPAPSYTTAWDTIYDPNKDFVNGQYVVPPAEQ